LMSLVELKTALDDGAGGVDALFMDSCIMQTVETAHILSKSVALLAGSARVSFGFAHDLYLAQLAQTPSASLNDLSKMITAAYNEQYEESRNSFTFRSMPTPAFSLLQTERLDPLMRGIRQWADTVMAAGDAQAVIRGRSYLDGGLDMVDLGELLDGVNKKTRNPEVKNATNQLIEEIKKAFCVEEPCKYRRRVSIYLPQLNSANPAIYKLRSGMDDTGWLEFVDWLYQTQKQQAAEQARTAAPTGS